MIRARSHLFVEKKGFTFLELMLVIVILGVLVLVVFPKIPHFGERGDVAAIRRLSGLIRHLSQESASHRKNYRLYFNLDEASYWVSVEKQDHDTIEFVRSNHDPLLQYKVLPQGLFLEEVVTSREGTIQEGETYIEVTPFGMDRASIHLKSKTQEWTLAVEPLTGRVKVLDETQVE